MSTQPERTSQDATTFFVPESPLPIQEPRVQIPLEEAFHPDENLLDIPIADVPPKEALVAIEAHTIQPGHASAIQLQFTGPDHRIPLLARTRQSRLEAESVAPSDHPIHRFMRKTLIGDNVQIGGVAQWAIEFLPGFIWGPGDALSLYMAIRRQNPLTGETIDRFDAGLCVIAACIPFVPAKALTGPARMIRRILEEGYHALNTRDYHPVLKALTVKNVAKFAFAIF